ncbi:MAG: SpoIID/LytB domain-containing protein [Acidobacteria bacterium]|nr:MAG: SpoIID/LytB domain-containing protein [Acidobacteriota bacterium]
MGAACGGQRPAPAVSPAAPAVQTAPEIRVRVAGRIVTVALEDYVAATALSEITPVGESAETIARMYDVQTIVARSYALAHLGRHRAEGFDLCDTTHCQLYEPARLASSRFSADARRAAARTAGEVLTYGASPIDALFHADCGGHTTSPEQVWGSTGLPYLRPEPDDVPALTHRTWSLTLTRFDLIKALDADERTSIGDTLKSVVLADTDSSGRVSRVTINGDRRVTLRSDDFRNAVNKRLGARAMMSTRFRMSRAANGADYVLSGSGFGHGIGLCQVGALARARRGVEASEILATYFPGARLRTLSVKLP